MQITDILAQTGGAQSIARDLGISEADVTKGAQALGPMLLGGFRKQAQTGGGAGLGGLLSQLGGGGLLDSVLSPGTTDVTPGDAVLGQVFGSKEVSRTAAQTASAQSGLNPALLKKMLPLLAMLVAGYLAKNRGGAAPGGGAGGGIGGMIGGMLGGGQPGAGAAGGGMGGFASMLDADGDGNPLDDLMRMVGKKSPG